MAKGKRKATGSAKQHRGRWVARVRWSSQECANCGHSATLHDLKSVGRPCNACGEACRRTTTPRPRKAGLPATAARIVCGYEPARHEWRQIAEPNTKAVALECAREFAREIERGGGKPPAAAPPPRLFRDLAAEYIDANVRPAVYAEGVKLGGMKDHAGVRATIEKVLLPTLGDRPIDGLTFADLQRFRDSRLSAPKLRGGKTVAVTTGTRSIARVNREMSTLRSILNYGVDSGYIARNPMKASSSNRARSLVVLKAEIIRDRVMTRAEERRLHAAYLSTPEITRSHDYFTVATDTGMRAGELLALMVSDCDFEAQLIRLRWLTTKSKKSRTIPLSQRALAILRLRCAAARPEGLIFGDLSRTAVRKDFLRAKAVAKVEGLHWHDLRATLATRLHSAGISLEEIARFTGHRFRKTEGEEGTAPILQKHYLRGTPEALNRTAAAIDAGNGEAVN